MFEQLPKQLSISSWSLPRAINRRAHYIKLLNITSTFVASFERKSKFIVSRAKNSALTAFHVDMMIDSVKHSLNPQDKALAEPFVSTKKTTACSSGSSKGNAMHRMFFGLSIGLVIPSSYSGWTIGFANHPQRFLWLLWAILAFAV